MNKKLIAIAALLALMMTVCVFALAEDPADPFFPGLLDDPTPPPLEKHVHNISIRVMSKDYNGHTLHEWCPDCGRLLQERSEGHSFTDGVCDLCGWKCTHAEDAEDTRTEREGVRPQWDGTYIEWPGWEITECGTCRTELRRREIKVREFHNMHTVLTPVLECVSLDSDTHALIRFCEDCGTELPKYEPHDWKQTSCTEGGANTHIFFYECTVCGARKETEVPHALSQYFVIWNEKQHLKKVLCRACGLNDIYLEKHVFDENEMCACGYHRDDPVSEAMLSGEALPYSSGNQTAAPQVFCHLTADGQEIPYSYTLAPFEDGNFVGFGLLPGNMPGNPVFEVRFTVSEFGTLQKAGANNVYICINNTDLLLLNDIGQALAILSEQESGELIITLTPGSDGAYTVRYDPASVYIME